MKISSIKAIEILDSRGKPTVRTFVTLEDGSLHSASVPSGASTGSHEAIELSDGDSQRYMGLGVQKAVNNVNNIISRELKGFNVEGLKKIDKKMIEMDGTENKSKLGANAILSVSMAVARAAAHVSKKPLWKFLNEYYFSGQVPHNYPKLMVNIVNGGKHASWNFDIQEFMIVPISTKPSESVRIASEIFHSLGTLLKEKKLSTLVGDEGGYSPYLSSNEEVFETIIESAKKLGYENNREYNLAIDAAATEFYKDGKYILHKLPHEFINNSAIEPSQTRLEQSSNGSYLLEGSQLIEYYQSLQKDYSLISFEDPFSEDDWEDFKKFTGVITGVSKEVPLVIGDDLFVTNVKRIEKGIQEKTANSVLIKLNQIGTVSETADAIHITKKAGWKTIISHRSGETEDPFIADLAYGSGADFIKTGSMSRSERLAKYNRLLEIENDV